MEEPAGKKLDGVQTHKAIESGRKKDVRENKILVFSHKKKGRQSWMDTVEKKVCLKIENPQKATFWKRGRDCRKKGTGWQNEAAKRIVVLLSCPPTTLQVDKPQLSPTSQQGLLRVLLIIPSLCVRNPWCLVSLVSGLSLFQLVGGGASQGWQGA